MATRLYVTPRAATGAPVKVIQGPNPDMIPDGFVVVKPAPLLPEKRGMAGSDVKDLVSNENGAPTTRPISALKALLQSVPKGPSGLKGLGKPLSYRTRLAFTAQATSGAASTQAPVISLIPGSSAEFASWANLFDEYKCHGGEYFHKLSLTNGANVNGVDYALAYDPLSAGAYTSVEAVIVASQNTGPLAATSRTSALQDSPDTTNSRGFHVFKFMVPRGVALPDPAALSNYTSDTWVDTGVATASFGLIKGFVLAPSVGASTLRGYLVLDVEFRIRS